VFKLHRHYRCFIRVSSVAKRLSENRSPCGTANIAKSVLG
jgi:hypothetical protein